MHFFVGSLEDLSKLINALRAYGYVTYGYRVAGDSIVFGEVHDLKEMPVEYLDIQEPGSYRLVKGDGVRHSFASPKEVFLPPLQEVFRVDSNDNVSYPPLNSRRIALVGIKSCDLASIKVMDRILANDDSYTARRRGVLIIVEECVNPGNTCFCGSLGTGPYVSEDFDLAYARIDNEHILFKCGSRVGLSIARKLRLKPASEEVITTYNSLMSKAKDKASPLRFRLDVIESSMFKSMSDVELWKELSKNCVGCANCNLVCPTCFCTEFLDDLRLDNSASRVRFWVGCLSYAYGLVAGAHFRPELYMRYRHFILHKFLFYRKQIGLIGCIGCGRCIVWCPVGIDIRKTVSEVVRKYG